MFQDEKLLNEYVRRANEQDFYHKHSKLEIHLDIVLFDWVGLTVLISCYMTGVLWGFAFCSSRTIVSPPLIWLGVIMSSTCS